MRWLFPILLALVSAGCGDDDNVPCGCPDAPWSPADLPAEFTDGGIWDLSATDTRAVALAVTGDGAFVIEEGILGWEIVGSGPLPGTAPIDPARAAIEPSRAASGITLDAAGKIQVVGAAVAGMTPVVWSESGGDWLVEDGGGSGFLQDVVPLGSSDILAAGTGSTGIPWVTGSAGTAFVYDRIPLGGEAGLVGLDEYSGTIYGIGFNDAAEGTAEDPYRIVMKFVGGAWESMPSPCFDCASHDFRALAATPGALYVGGVATLNRTADEPYGNGIAIETAWLAQYSWQESEWTQLILPDSELLQRVNAVLAASDGSVYVACGSPDTSAYLLRMEPGAAPVVEQVIEGVRLFRLVETPDGRILAAGLEEGTVESWPLLLERAR